jgi:hypothetical protein
MPVHESRRHGCRGGDPAEQVGGVDLEEVDHTR